MNSGPLPGSGRDATPRRFREEANVLLKGVVIEWQRACEKVKREQERDAAKEAHKQKFVKMSAGQQPIFWGLFLGTLFW